MSMTQYTVKELKEFIKDLPDNMLVVTRAHNDVWVEEGMFDGLIPYTTNKLWEIRTGLIPSDNKWWDGDILVLSDDDEEGNIDWWNERVEGKLEYLKVKE